MRSADARVGAFHRNAIRVAVRGALSVSAVLGLGLGIAAVPAPASAAASALVSASPASAAGLTNPRDAGEPDFDHDALRLSTTTDTLPEDQAANYEAIAGDPVERVYYLHNTGLLPLENVTVSDPGDNGATIHCGPSGTATIAMLLPLAVATCSATFAAVPGEQHTTATASGTVFLFNVTLTDNDQTGYTAVVPALGASLSLNGGQSTASLPVGNRVSAVITMVNSGSAPLDDVGPLPPAPPLSIIGCGGGVDGGGNGPTVDKLNPGQSAFCTGVLVPQPGAHAICVTVAGDWQWDHPINAQGPQQPQVLRVQTVATGQYTGAPVTSPPPPPSPSPSSPAPPPPTPGPVQTVPAVVIPQSPLPSPSPTPSQRPTPAPTRTQAAALLQPAVSQFQASRGLSLPLKVLVIIIIPAVAGAIGARRIASSSR